MTAALLPVPRLQAMLVKIVTEILFWQCACDQPSNNHLGADHEPANQKDRDSVPAVGALGEWRQNNNIKKETLSRDQQGQNK